MFAKPAALALLAAFAACASPPRKAPTRNTDGLFITGRAKFDAYFQDARQFEAAVKELEARLRALAPVVAIALELPKDASIDDLALGLGKVAKRSLRSGGRAEIRLTKADAGSARSVSLELESSDSLSPRVREQLDKAFEAVRNAVGMDPELDAAICVAESLREQAEELLGDVERAFRGRGADYVKAVDRELERIGHQLDDGIARLMAERDFVVMFSDKLASATRLEARTP